MPVYFCDPTKGSLSSAMLRIGRRGEQIAGVVAVGAEVAILTNGGPVCEARVEQPDTRGGASRVVSEGGPA